MLLLSKAKNYDTLWPNTQTADIQLCCSPINHVFLIVQQQIDENKQFPQMSSRNALPDVSTDDFCKLMPTTCCLKCEPCEVVFSVRHQQNQKVNDPACSLHSGDVFCHIQCGIRKIDTLTQWWVGWSPELVKLQYPGWTKLCVYRNKPKVRTLRSTTSTKLQRQLIQWGWH